jgi:hypothetical protein
MPGSIKVSGAQKTIAAPYVKVSGTWRPAAVAYVKVSGTWRQWYAADITDTFDRANANSLGTVSNGVTSWTALSGSWAIASNQATSSTSPSSYPVATVTSPLSSTDYELKIDVPAGAGPGVALWVTDASNWYAVTTNLVTTNNYSCPSGGTVSGTDCVITSTYNATATTYNCGSPYSYDCNYSASYRAAGYVYNGAFCSGCSGPGANDGTLQCTTINGQFGCWEIIPAGYYCPNGGTLSGSTCLKTCSGCGTGGSDPCATCTSYSCSPGDSLNGTICTSTSTYSATNTPTYTYTTRLIKNTSGTKSTLVTYSHSSAVRSLKVTTSNDTVSISAYSGTGQSGLLDTNNYAVTTPTKTAVAGIIISPASSSQGTTLDNFYMK